MQYSALVIAALAGAASAVAPRQIICNAAAIARGDCTATAAIVPTICNAAAIARGDCTATAASVPTTLPFICNAAAIARGDCTATAATVPTSLPFICNAAAIARGDCSATAGINGTANVVYTTQVVTSLVTYCPYATVLTVNNQAYTVTAATTLTITNCPCTVVQPVTAAPVPTPFICNAAAIARGACTATAASVPAAATTPAPATTPFICNAAAIARGDCSAPAANVPTATATATKAVYTGAAEAVKPAMALLAVGVAAFL